MVKRAQPWWRKLRWTFVGTQWAKSVLRWRGIRLQVSKTIDPMHGPAKHENRAGPDNEGGTWWFWTVRRGRPSRRQSGHGWERTRSGAKRAACLAAKRIYDKLEKQAGPPLPT